MRSFILGTDWWTDCDDAMAVRLLVNAHKAGDIELKGICINACMPESVASLDAYVRQSGILALPIGIDREATDFGGQPSYQHRLATTYPHRLDNDSAEDGVALYRRLIAESTDPVELLDIGFPQVLAALLASPADQFSPLAGCELVKAKVAHLWFMAGKWDEPEGCENNFARNARAAVAAAKICADWPTPVTFLGWEVGNTVISGGDLPLGDPLQGVMADHGSVHGRSSWDPMLALMAMIGSPEDAGYSCVYGKATVNPENGHNFFRKDANAPHRFVVKRHPDKFYSTAINQRLDWIH